MNYVQLADIASDCMLCLIARSRKAWPDTVTMYCSSMIMKEAFERGFKQRKHIMCLQVCEAVLTGKISSVLMQCALLHFTLSKLQMVLLPLLLGCASGKIDVIEDVVENEFVKGPCKRLSIRVSLMDPQVQFAPVTGAADHFVHQKHMKDGGTAMIENLFLGFETIGRADTRLAVRLIGGTWGRRIVPWIKSNEIVQRSVRISMMRPATRVDLYLPKKVKLLVNVGDEVAGGQSVVAKFE